MQNLKSDTFPRGQMMRAKRFKLLIGFFLIGMAQPIHAQDNSPQIIRVEEDWELIVSTPDPNRDAPQISTWMSPTNSLGSDHFGVDINHAQRAGHAGGGFQTKRMSAAQLIEDRCGNIGAKLQVDGETIRWTQLLAIIEQDVVFAVKNGTSISWGNFGGPDTLIRIPISLGNLNGYDPNLSCESSGVGFALNRVASLKLLRIRLHTNRGITETILDRAIQ